MGLTVRLINIAMLVDLAAGDMWGSVITLAKLGLQFIVPRHTNRHFGCY